jgi:D-beta-D-heptose 7-phosphate kinase/D-beta-D-heptose 1-phosphate adenosyltransferase
MAATLVPNIDFLSIIQAFKTKRVLVVGDFILDVYVKGISTRLCPEAPVPVVDVTERTELLGGAANTACNIATLGADVYFASVIGNDEDSDKAIDLLQQAGIDTGKIVRSGNRKTIVKTRVMAGAHVLTRFDTGDESPIDDACSEALVLAVEEDIAQYDAIIISDYAKGVITQRLIDALAAAKKYNTIFIAVDSKRLAVFRDLKPSLVKPNYDEAVKLLGLAPQGNGRSEQLETQGEAIYTHTQADITALTLDAEGSLLFDKDNFVYKTAAPVVTNPNVSGAGDTYISAFTLACITGASLATASAVATAAAAIAVQKEGTASCSCKELQNHFDIHSKYIYSQETLAMICDLYRTSGRRIVFTNGCFDILHSGHVSYLEKARELGDVLIVGINTDESIKRLKGEMRPINTLADRMKVLAGLRSVDYVIAFGSEENDTPEPVLEVAKPHIFAKGGDYTEADLPEAGTVRKNGGEIVFIPLVPDHSTSIIIQRIHTANTSQAHDFTTPLHEAVERM